MLELLIAANPDPDSSLAYLLKVPVGEGIVLRTSGTWPRAKALYCYPVPASEWPDAPEIVERVPLRACARRGAAIDLVAARGRESRSQLVFTTARGREAVFWQSPRTRKQARPNVTVPTARASGVEQLEIIVDTRERYAYRFAGQQARTVPGALRCGDYGVAHGGQLVAAVERKSLDDLVSSLSSGRLRFALAELATLPRAAVVVEDRYSQVFKQRWLRPSAVADGLAEYQVRWPTVPIVFCESRTLAEEWTYRYLAAAHVWAAGEEAAAGRVFGGRSEDAGVPDAPAAPRSVPSPANTAAEIRAWARANGYEVSDRGRIASSVRRACEEARALRSGPGAPRSLPEQSPGQQI